ncbi:Protein kinase, putative [Hondaea fermentalgiana]|uniref:Protein kinase, putative n=1 Tax=Hondaea fermentalgiana TaxID=2315210 RepID=A0A2R5GHV1_9STRA|nr:Protein kinase, putative [Hondaea fermentalgiana]|eukprot:GBG27454.1 Protein kinase, putative [Hondaea fermentalgiana]
MGCVSSSSARHDLEGKPVGLKHFDKGRVLGEGGFGKVKAVTKRGEAPLRWHAMKILNKENVVDKRRFQEIFRERDMLTSLRHERICNLYYAFQDPKHLYLVMDLALGGDLRYQLNHNAQGLPFTETRTRIYVAQVIEALDYVHSQGIIHRDVKPENLLLNGNGWVMLTDFGIARDVDEAGLCQSGSGTGGYMPPEIYTRSHAHSKTADWFALGVTMHEFLTKRRPFRGDDIRRAGRMLTSSGKIKPSYEKEGATEPLATQFLQDCQTEDFGLSSECVDLLSRLFCVRRGLRLGAGGLTDFTSHAWFSSSDSFEWSKIVDGTHEVPFLPNTNRMNAEPDADIHAVFMGDEEERRLRSLTVEEQKLFEGYEYDYTAPQPSVPRVRDFGGMSGSDSRKSVATVDGAGDSFASRAGVVPTQPRTPRVRTAQRYTTRSMDEVALSRQQVATTNSTSSETTRGVDADDDDSHQHRHSKEHRLRLPVGVQAGGQTDADSPQQANQRDQQPQPAPQGAAAKQQPSSGSGGESPGAAGGVNVDAPLPSSSASSSPSSSCEESRRPSNASAALQLVSETGMTLTSSQQTVYSSGSTAGKNEDEDDNNVEIKDTETACVPSLNSTAAAAAAKMKKTEEEMSASPNQHQATRAKQMKASSEKSGDKSVDKDGSPGRPSGSSVAAS